MIGTHFENQLIRKYVIVFGTLFNNVQIARSDGSNPKADFFKVPIEFAPREKSLAMLRAKPDGKRINIQLPRMSFEITGMQPDTQRKIGREKVIRSGNKHVYKGVPWDINFQLNVIAKNSFDATKIAEQVLWYFNPDYTVDVQLLDGLDHEDRIPIVYTSSSQEDFYEDDLIRKRAVTWEINFVLKGWLYGPVSDSKVIKHIDVRTHADMNKNGNYVTRQTIQPGLTEDGEPTTDINETIPFFEINEEDDWAVIEQIFRNDEE